MTRWLAVVKEAQTQKTKLAEPIKAQAQGVKSVLSVLSKGKVPQFEPVPLDHEGLPMAPCPRCGGGMFWKPAAQPFNGEGWLCESCAPPPLSGLRHACAVPV